MKEREARLLLATLAEPGDERLGSLITEFGIVEACELSKNGRAGEALRKKLARKDLSGLVNAVAQATKDCGARFITPDDDEWPLGLADLDFGLPIGLWVRGMGQLRELTETSVAIVGARASTAYGERIASDLGSQLAASRVVSVSGAAYGIDAAAHRGSIAGQGKTIAVLACGVDVAYPRAHQGLLDRIVDHGLIVSEGPPKTEPHKHRFLIRNRLIAALSQSTVVVEAALRSGSLSTSMWAHSIGRQVWGIPGPLTSAASAGVHAAIRDGVMELVTELSDVIPAVNESVLVTEHLLSSNTEIHQHIVRVLAQRSSTTDQLVLTLPDFPAHEVLSALTLLEITNIAKQVDSYWILNG